MVCVLRLPRPSLPSGGMDAACLLQLVSLNSNSKPYNRTLLSYKCYIMGCQIYTIVWGCHDDVILCCPTFKEQYLMQQSAHWWHEVSCLIRKCVIFSLLLHCPMPKVDREGGKVRGGRRNKDTVTQMKDSEQKTKTLNCWLCLRAQGLYNASTYKCLS